MSVTQDNLGSARRQPTELFAQFAAQLRELGELLAAEFEAIRSRDADAITGFATTKQALVGQIDVSVASLGSSLDALIDDPQAFSNGLEIIELMRQCKNANRVNGAAIESSQTFAGALLDIMRGRTPGDAIYTANGRLGRGLGTNASLVRI